MRYEIPNREDYQLTVADGLSSTQFRLDFSGRLFITGFDGGEPMHCTSHALADIKQIHDLTGAIIAQLEERR